MPRKSKTQPIATTAPGQPYGVASEQQAAMKTIPLPNTVVQANPVAPAGNNVPSPPVPTATQSIPTPVNTQQSNSQVALNAALNTTPPAGAAFSDPPRYPQQNNPIMPTPLSAPKSAVANILNMIAESHGNDPALIAIAANAARKGY
jgi:hypothetical protein